MADNLTALVGVANMTAAAKPTVIRILASSPLPPTSRRYLYAQWARRVGVALDPADTDHVAPAPAR